MTIAAAGPQFVDVLREAKAGRLDESTPEDATRDLAIIWSYIQAEKHASDQRPGTTVPAIARAVLTSVWEAPRVTFHREELQGLTGVNFRSKLLLIPWSMEAFESLRGTDEVAGLILEHVMPVDALWARLVALVEETESEEEWALEAYAYLSKNYTLAVVTRAQASAIDLHASRATGVEGRPFLRYERAGQVLRELAARGETTVSLDVTRFVHSGLAGR